nr:uncharacterized protein LOC110379491 [Helicoverpa armigera]
MTLSPKKYVSNYTTSTAQRGVHAKEVELGNTNLELDMSASTPCAAESSAGSAGRAPDAGQPPVASNDETGSYLQVVVEKHRRARSSPPPRAASPRLPAASSPLAHNQGGRGDGGGVYVLPHPLLLACPAGSPMCTALQAHPYFARSGRALADAATSPSRAAPPPARAASPPPAPPQPPKKYHTWKLLRGIGMERSYENEPDRVELYYFEHGAGEFLSAWSGERVTRLERAARPAQRLARAALAELLAAPRLLAALPVALLLQLARCALAALRGAAAGLLQTASDVALKPALALTFNALLQPLLVFAQNVSRGVRAALQPLAALLGDVAEPAARLLAAVRLVDVRLTCPHHTV